MKTPDKTNFTKLAKWMATGLFASSMVGCGVEESTLNTETAVYTPETRPLGVVAQDNVEVQPGESVTLTSRLVGTTSGQTLRWEQISGGDISLSATTGDSISFVTPANVAADLIEFEVIAVDANGDVVRDENNQVIADSMTVTVIDPSLSITLDVTDGELVGAVIADASNDHYVAGANGDTHTADMEPGHKIVYNIDDKQGFFTLYVRYLIPSDYGGKVGNIKVNGVSNLVELDATGQWTELRVGAVKLVAGENIIEVGGGWNYYRVDEISLIPAIPPAKPLAVEASLVNENASGPAKSLMKFLSEHYATRTISGQTEFPNGSGAFNELFQANRVIEATGDDAPGIVAFDYMRYSPNRGDTSGTLTEDMIKHYQENNIILSPLWHWVAPAGNTDSSKGFYTSDTDFDLAAALADTDSAEYQALVSDMDVIAAELKKFADKEIPLLWRPLHEADGAWFWWGAAGADAQVALWKLMYDRYTNHHGLNNLIWVYTHSERLVEEFYPGDEYVDIVGYDGYDSNNDQNPFINQFKRLKRRFDGKKILALTETGTIPDVKLMHDNAVFWSYFVTWNGDFSDEYGPANLDASIIDMHYDYEGVLNRDEIPGSQPPVGPGVLEDFDGTGNYVLQADWSAERAMNAGAAFVTTEQWAATGTSALSATIDLMSITDWGDFPSVVIQNYPENGLDVSSATGFNISVNAQTAGAGVTAKLWVKHGTDASWVDAGAVAITDGGVHLSIDVTEYDLLAGYGIQFEGFDLAETAASFFIDHVSLTQEDGAMVVVDNFEQVPEGFHAQWDWGTTPGLGITTEWSVDSAKSLVFSKDLSAKTDWGDFPSTVIQVYPAEVGIDVAGKATFSLNAHAVGAGDSVTAKLFVKHGSDWSWVDAGGQAIGADGIALSIDVTEYDWLAGFGVQFEGFDTTSTQAKFFIDNVAIDDANLYNFEQIGSWEGQADWSPTSGATVSESWGVNGSKSILFNMDMSAKADWGDFPSTVLQNYPEVNIKDVSTMRLTANAVDAGTGVTAKLFIKHGDDWSWVDAGAVVITDDGVELSIDVSGYDFLAGWGVQFEGFDTSSTDAKFYVDKIVFE
ncbi:glycosyl hydrolase [Paraglaciecola sp.]|uniref:glycosyl hydrolase n=1 Tax=Paraglaciecola sp. TaxID=1920173 RepID=UPI003EF3F1BD